MNPEMFGDGTLDKSRFARQPRPKDAQPQPSRSQSRKTELRRGNGPKRKRIKEVSDERGEDSGTASCVRSSELKKDGTGSPGFYACECGDPECNAQIEGFDEARRFFQPGHVKPRASFNHKGFRLSYTPTLGPDDPDNIVPVSPSCNVSEFWRRNQSQPQWSGSKWS